MFALADNPISPARFDEPADGCASGNGLESVLVADSCRRQGPSANRGVAERR